MNSIGKNFQATGTIEQKITFFIDLLSSVSTLTYESFYLLDYSNKRLLYVSENPFPLYKLSQEELISKGFDFYLSFLNEKEREFFLWLQRVGRKKMTEVDEARRLSSFLTYDFHNRVIFSSCFEEKGRDFLGPFALFPAFCGLLWPLWCVSS